MTAQGGKTDCRNEAKTTGAPWEWRGNQLYAPARQLTLLRDVTFWNCDPADKALIAAAPELLEAAQAFVRWADGTEALDVIPTSDVDEARAAIAKAEGRT